MKAIKRLFGMGEIKYIELYERNGYQEVKGYVESIGFKEQRFSFTNKNLIIYFRDDKKEWRLKDRSILFSDMDISRVKLPLDDENKSHLFAYCSQYWKDNAVDPITKNPFK